MYQDPFLEGKVKKILGNIKVMLAKENLNVEEIFNMYDKNDSQTLDFQEFSEMIQKIDENVTDKEIEYIFRRLDQDGNESIEVDELKRALGGSIIFLLSLY